MITRRSRRRMTPTAKRIAALHNDAVSLARRLKSLAHDVAMMELSVTRDQLDRSDRAAFGPIEHDAPQCRQTACRYCGLDIEGFSPYRAGSWHDRGGNNTCNKSRRFHAPVKG